MSVKAEVKAELLTSGKFAMSKLQQRRAGPSAGKTLTVTCPATAPAAPRPEELSDAEWRHLDKFNCSVDELPGRGTPVPLKLDYLAMRMAAKREHCSAL